MAKSRDAFRTISEVSQWLDIPAHVLRFWESRFNQIKPVKRAGGRRYYRPNDMLLLGGIKRLLHDDGITIKGVQKILREKGVGHVSSLSAELISDQPVAPSAADIAKTDVQAIDTTADISDIEGRLTAAFPISEAFDTPHPQAPAPIITEGRSAILPDILAVQEIDKATREERIFALYQRLKALRNRVYQGMING
jgi:DNA-binding transcriptional MerR regulator